MRNSINRGRRNKHREPARSESPEVAERQPAPEDVAAEPEAAEPPEKKIRSQPSKLPMWDFLEDDARDTDGTFRKAVRRLCMVRALMTVSNASSNRIASKLGNKTAAAYYFQLERLRAYCVGRGAVYMRDLSIDLLEDC